MELKSKFPKSSIPKFKSTLNLGQDNWNFQFGILQDSTIITTATITSFQLDPFLWFSGK